MKSYEEQVQEQIEQYRETEVMHDLPAVFHTWSADYVGPGLREVYGVSDINSFYAEAFLAAADARADGGEPRFLSLGCGDGAVEIGIAELLVARGMTRFRFVCFELSDILLGRFRAALPAGLAGRFELVCGDLNGARLGAGFDGIMANHTLHHIVDLEGVYRTCFESLAPGGIFVTSDMIGRNGHLRWPEARLFVEFFWPFLTLRQRRNVQLRREERRFIDHDCAGEGFEGVRAEEVLPKLLEAGFHPARFFGYGGFADVFTDRGFGPNLDVEDADDLFLARRIGWLNELLLDAGLVKPTMMLAWFTKQAGPEVCYRGRTARGSVRAAGVAPGWAVAAAADRARVSDDPDYVFRQWVAAPAPVLATPVVAAVAPDAGVVGELVAALRQAQGEAVAARAEAERYRGRVEALLGSTSWRAMGPVRRLIRLLRG